MDGRWRNGDRWCRGFLTTAQGDLFFIHQERVIDSTTNFSVLRPWRLFWFVRWHKLAFAFHRRAYLVHILCPIEVEFSILPHMQKWSIGRREAESTYVVYCASPNIRIGTIMCQSQKSEQRSKIALFRASVTILLGRLTQIHR